MVEGPAPRAVPRATVPFLVLLTGGICIGFAPVLVRLSDVGPVASAFWRMCMAAPLIWVLAIALRRRDARSAATDPAIIPARAEWRPIVLSGVLFAADLAVWHFSITRTTVANATLLANCAPLFVTLYALLVHRQRPGSAFLLALALAFGGAVALVGPSFSLGATRVAGDALAVLAAMFYTAYMLTIKRARDSVDTMTLMALSTTITAIALLPAAWLMAQAASQPFLPATPQGWQIVLLLALVTQVGGQCCIAYALAHLPVTLSTTALLIQPLVAAAAAWWLFEERLSGSQLLGAAVLLLGIYLARRSSPA